MLRFISIVAAIAGLLAFALWRGAGTQVASGFDANRVADILRNDPAPQHQPKWEMVPYPNMNGDDTRLAYDANSITVTNDEKGRVNGADVTAHIMAGDISIRGKYVVLSFDCGSGTQFGFHYRINHSYPLPLPSLPSQEGYIANIACSAAKCEILRRQGGSCG
jgi:hypothetical protein